MVFKSPQFHSKVIESKGTVCDTIFCCSNGILLVNNTARRRKTVFITTHGMVLFYGFNGNNSISKKESIQLNTFKYIGSLSSAALTGRIVFVKVR